MNKYAYQDHVIKHAQAERSAQARQQTKEEELRAARYATAYRFAARHLSDLTDGGTGPCPWAVWAVLDATRHVTSQQDPDKRRAALVTVARSVHAKRSHPCGCPTERQEATP